MNYGHFDDQQNEYVITLPDTPSPWINYLGTGGHSGIISNTAGGTSFYKDPQHCRLLRYRVNSLPSDRPGRYIYLRDQDSGEYWSPSWQPVMKQLDAYECRHGFGYTVITGKYNGIEAQTTYFVPIGKDYEIWRLRITNNSKKARRLSVFNYAEFGHFDALLDLKASWSVHCMDTVYHGNGLVTFDPMVEKSLTPFIGCFATNGKVASHDLSREEFVGLNRTEGNPVAVERGRCANSTGKSTASLGAFCIPVSVRPGETKEVDYVLGIAADLPAARRLAKRALVPATIEKDLTALKKHWIGKFTGFQVKCPDKDITRSLNTWHQYQTQLTFYWSRFISYYERGMERGYGFRDTMQDTLGVMHVMPEEAREKINMLLAIQFKAGNCKAVYFPFAKKAEGGGRSDDQLWSPIAVGLYLKETGNYDYLKQKLPYADGGTGTVLEHLERGVDFSLRTVGRNGFPLFLRCDWNDSLAPINRKGNVESSFVFFMVGVALRELAGIYRAIGNEKKLAWAEQTYRRLQKQTQKLWTGKWFARGYDDNGKLFGTAKNKYAKMFLNPQSWAVMSGFATPKQGRTAFESVNRQLNSDFGVHLLAPGAPYLDPENGGYFPMPAGARENGGIFCHANTWAIIAETINRRNETAFEYYQKLLPYRNNNRVNRTQVEPYVYAQCFFGRDHALFGRGQNSWLSGTASWMFIAATHYILGLRPDHNGLIIDPCLPAKWSGYETRRVFRGFNITVRVRNTRGKRRSLRLNGQAVSGNLIPLKLLITGENIVESEV